MFLSLRGVAVLLTSAQWSALAGVVQGIAAVVSLIVIWVYSSRNQAVVEQQQAALEVAGAIEAEKEKKMARKVALVLYRRLWKIGVALDGIATLQGAMMFVMDPLDKGIPDELIVLHLEPDMTFRIFDLFDRLRDDHVNVSKVLEGMGEDIALKDFQEVAINRCGVVNGIREDLAKIAGV